MKALVSRRALQLLTGVALALSAGLFLAPASARASCGDYVIMGEHSQESTAALPDAQPSSPVQLPVPCSGPHCSRMPAVPPLAPVTIPVVHAEDWAYPSGLLRTSDPAGAPLTFDDARVQPIHRATSIYHPPR